MTSVVGLPGYRFQSFELRPQDRSLLRSGKPVAVGPHALDVLIALVERSGRLVTKEELLEQVWGKIVVEPNTLQAHVSALRKVLGAEAIATVSGRGYRFIPAVERNHQADDATLKRRRHNLPYALTTFIGREAQLAEVHQLLETRRLLTLIGSGGCGKTRLALQVAWGCLESHADGVWFAELAPIRDPALIAQAIADALGVRPQLGKPVDGAVIDWLASRHVLLVLDNAEHLIDACAHLADQLLRRCARLTLLVTSRERLGVTGEQSYRVPSLSVPDATHQATPEEILDCEAARLFVDRARLQRPDFDGRPEAAVLASICRRLDGIALALELAAPCVRTMSLIELSRQLDARFTLLTGGSRTALPRHRTLRSLIDWSYELLDTEEQALLRRVSVFSGGCTLEAVQAVCADSPVAFSRAPHVLNALVAKSLLVQETLKSTTRYKLLETIQHYASDQLRDNQEEADARRHHLGHFVEFADDAIRHLKGPAQAEWFDRLEEENDNLRAALSWSSSDPQAAEAGLALAASLWPFWLQRGLLDEGRRWLAVHLAAASNRCEAAMRARALYAAGVLARNAGDYVNARKLLDEALAIRRNEGDRKGAAQCMGALGAVVENQGDHARARELKEQALVLFRELDDKPGIARGLTSLGTALWHAGDFDAAQACQREALALCRQLGDATGEAAALMNLAEGNTAQGNHAEAIELFAAAESIYQKLGDQRQVARTKRLMACSILDSGDVERGCALLMTSLSEFQRLGDETELCEGLYTLAVARSPLDPRGAAVMWGAVMQSRQLRGVHSPYAAPGVEADQMRPARTALGDDEFAAAWAQGSAMSLQEALHFACDQGARMTSAEPTERGHTRVRT